MSKVFILVLLGHYLGSTDKIVKLLLHYRVLSPLGKIKLIFALKFNSWLCRYNDNAKVQVAMTL